ncbi:MAG: FAD-binding protein [Eubacterium sp.]|nr:FAD-binding protein [Eubacterium sp.]
MGKVLIIGCGISGLSSAISLAEKGIKSVLVSPFPSERAQSVMAAGGINAVDDCPDGADSVEKHISDTIKGGSFIAGKEAVTGLCKSAASIIDQLERMGMVFTKDSEGRYAKRAFGGQSFNRTCFSGASTGKQIVTSLIMECRKYESDGLIERMMWTDFHSGLIRDGRIYGALLFSEATRELFPVYADAVIVATGGQNTLFGKTTGSTTCDGYTAGKLFTQGAELKNLEFIQYHPTTIETVHKRMLISEAARGEGGRLFCNKDGDRFYFMEEKFGPKGNLMPRDVVSSCMHKLGTQVYLDVSFLKKDIIMNRLYEVYDVCKKYRNIDITREPIPVEPSIHFFMGGLAVKNNHETNIEGLYAVGECASIYHGANRLGGNSLLSAIYGGQVAASSIKESYSAAAHSTADFTEYIKVENDKFKSAGRNSSKFPVAYIRDMVAEDMNRNLGIVRDEKSLEEGIKNMDYYMDIASKLNYDSNVLPYFNYSVPGILNLGKAILVSALSRKESRGSHLRSDYPGMDDEYKAASIVSYNDGRFDIRYDKEGSYER